MAKTKGNNIELESFKVLPKITRQIIAKRTIIIWVLSSIFATLSSLIL
jgi:hypothetical protein